MEHISIHSHCIPDLSFTFPKKKGRVKRDPYDGLRPWSAITHGAGAVLALLGTVLLVIRCWGSWPNFGACLVYGMSMVCLYTASTLYHCINTSVPGRLALRKYDHCSIYLLIAGSYTPVCLIALKGITGVTLTAVIWTLALAGIVLSILWIDCPRWLTSGVYLFMGWLALFAIGPISRALPPAGFAALVLGGVLYSIGGVLYAAKWPGRNNPRFGCHEIFHVFILLGSICHFWLICTIIAPM